MANVEAVVRDGKHQNLIRILSDGLIDDYDVIVSPVLGGQEFDVVVVGVQGLFILVDICGQQRETLHRARTKVRQQLGILTGIVQDRFTHMDPALFGVIVHDGPDPLDESDGIAIVALDSVTAYIGNLPALEDTELLDDISRGQVTRLLVERNKGVTERTRTPFMFQPLGGRQTVGRQVWTIEDALRYMDSHIEAGILVIEDGSLEQWLFDEGAIELARSAASARMTAAIDRRIPLERFLMASGLFKRPELKANPSVIDFGFVLPQNTYTRRVHIAKGSGNGYLYGTLQTDQPWLSVDPGRYYDGQVEAEIKVEGNQLDFLPGKYEGNLLVESNSAQEVLQIPIKLHLLSLPSTAERKIWRPLLHALFMALWGGILGLAWYLWSAPILGSIPQQAWYIYPTIAAGIWAILGFIDGRVQPTNSPVWYSILRVWSKTLLWGIELGALAALIYWSWEGLPTAELVSNEQILGGLVNLGLLGAFLGIIPTTGGRVRAYYDQFEPPKKIGNKRNLAWRRLVGAFFLIAALLFIPQYIRPYWTDMREAGVFDSAMGWIQDRWAKVENTLEGYLDNWYVERNDPRATTGED